MRFRPELLGVVESPLVQIATAAEAMPGALKLCYGESDMATPEFICRAAYDASLAGIMALRDGESYVGELRDHYAKRRMQAMNALAAIPGVSVPEARGAFYAFPRMDGLTDSTAFTADLLRRTGVALAPGVAFGTAGEGHVRLCFAATEQTLATALSRFREFMIDRARRESRNR